MNSPLRLIAILVFLFAAAPFSSGVLPPLNTQWDGVITAISPTSVSVQSPKGTKVFAIHPGTVFGQRAAKKAADFKTGDTVRVIFSTSGSQMKAENIRNPEDDKNAGPKKGKAAPKK